MSGAPRLRDRVRPLAVEVVDVPEWGGPVTLREMSGRARGKWSEEIAALPGDSEAAILRRSIALLRHSVWNPEENAPAFGPEDEEWLLDQSPRVLLRLSAVAARLSALTEKAKEVIAGESGAVPSGSSSSDSR